MDNKISIDIDDSSELLEMEFVDKFIASMEAKADVLAHIDEFDKEAHAEVKRMMIREHTAADYDRLFKMMPDVREFLKQRFDKRNVKKVKSL